MIDTEHVLEGVGPRLRSLRLRRGATLAELSDVTGISISTLSRLETGQRRPTLELLLPLARAHHVALDELVDAPDTGDPRVRLKPLVRDGRTFLPLTRSSGGLQAYKILLPPDRNAVLQEPRSHEGYEWLYVLSGTMHLKLGHRTVELKAGDVVEFDTHTPHTLTNNGSDVVELLALFGPQGERMYVRPRL